MSRVFCQIAASRTPQNSAEFSGIAVLQSSALAIDHTRSLLVLAHSLFARPSARLLSPSKDSAQSHGRSVM
jgi:hypothetical protein